MNLKFFFPLLAVALAGCATRPAEQRVEYTVRVAPAVDADITVYHGGTPVGEPVMRKKALAGETQFALIVTGDSPEAIGTDEIYVQASAPGYRTEGRAVRARTPHVELQLGELPQVRQSREHAADRAAYLEKHPAIVPALRQAIQDGRLVAGMDWLQANAAVGELQRDASSEGVGGQIEVYFHHDGALVTALYFGDGRLVRWTQFTP